MKADKIIDYIKNNKWIIVFAIIFFLGAILRTVNFSDWLVFKSDQARDALIMHGAREGSISDLQLLGPQVGGTDFRLGPITYYFQYLSAKIFGFTAESFAYPDLLFGILAIPILLLLFRKFFSMALSLWITALASASLLLVTFSRFGWNPNSLPFFTALFAFTFLTALESKGKRRLGYLILAAVSVGVIAQLHLMATLGVVSGLLVFMLLLRVLKWKEVLLCVVIVLTLNFPVLINEWETHGGNMKALKGAMSKKSSDSSEHTVYEKVFRAFQESARVNWIITTGQQNVDMISTKGLVIKCDKKCETALPYSMMAMFVLGYILVAGFMAWKNEIDLNRKIAIAFVGLWLSGFLFFSIFLAYQLEVRFFLGIVPPILVFLGLAIEKLEAISKKIWLKRLMIGGGIFIICLNLYSTMTYLGELNVSQTSSRESIRDLRFGTAPKVTLGQLRAIGSEASRHFANSAPVIVTGESLYAKSMYYVVSHENDFKGCYLRGDKEVPPEFNHLIIEYAPDEKAQVPFGTLSATFIAADSANLNISLPKGCIAY